MRKRAHRGPNCPSSTCETNDKSSNLKWPDSKICIFLTNFCLLKIGGPTVSLRNHSDPLRHCCLHLYNGNKNHTSEKKAMMVAQVNMALLFTQPHQNHNQTTETPLYITSRNGAEWKFYYGIKDETTSRLVGGAEMWNRLVPHPHTTDKNWEGYLWE